MQGYPHLPTGRSDCVKPDIATDTVSEYRTKPAAVRNEDIADLFEQLADLLEIDGANPFRVRAYRNAARMLRSTRQEMYYLIEQGEDLTKLPTIGKDLAGKIREIVRSGHLRMLDSLKRTMPAELAQLMRIPGLGPKRVKRLYDNLGIETLEGLRQAAMKGAIRNQSGFGERTEANIRAYFSADRSLDKRTLLYGAEKIASRILSHMSHLAEKDSIAIAGSYRRRKDTVGDLDVLVATQNPETAIDHFAKFEGIVQVQSKGKSRASALLRSGLQVDLRAVKPSSFGAAMVYFTGSKEHNIALRKRAIARGLKINEYGVFRGTKSIAGRTETDIYAAVGLRYIPPELREMHGELEAAEAGVLPSLIELEDIRGDLHMHTKASDGKSTLRDMATAAKRQGHSYAAITDHTKHVRIAHGLIENRLEKQIEEIDRLNEALSGIKILKSAEVDILADGSLDLSDTILEKLDLAICAIHFDFDLNPERQTERIIRAMDHPAFSILAHPTCRLIGDRDALRINMERLMDAALERGCFLEVNGQPQRLDLDDIHCRMAKERGLRLALSTDAHSINQLGFMQLSVGQARRGWIEKDDVLNTRPWRSLKRLLNR